MNQNEETFNEKLVRKFSKEPLVPLGCIITAGVLGSGIRAFSKGNSKLSQKFMRARVVAQGLTVAAIVFGAGLGLKPDRPKSFEEKLEQERALQAASSQTSK